MADTGNFPSEWDITTPTGADPRREGDDELRLVKKVVTNVTQDLDENPLSQGLIRSLFPVGAMVVETDPVLGDPTGSIGGTWVRNADITAHTPGTTDGAKTLYAFVRTA